MLLMQQPVKPAHMKDGDLEEFYRQARKIARERQLSKTSTTDQPTSNNDNKYLLWPFSSTLHRTPIRRRSTIKPDRRSSQTSPGSSSPPLRLADLAKQQVMAKHVDNWREDMVSVRQHLPMQHIIGSLKRDREEGIKIPRRHTTSNSMSSPNSSDVNTDSSSALSPSISRADIAEARQLYHNLVSSPSSNTAATSDSFLDLLRTPKTDATSPQPDTDRRFSYQAPEHIAKDIPQSALPGLNMALNLATITPDERDLFSEYAPRELDDPHVLMDEVIRMRDMMMDTEIQEDNEKDAEQGEEQQDVEMPVASEQDVKKDFDEFVNY